MVSRLLQDLRYRRAWLAVGAGLVALVVYLSLTPDPIEVASPPGLDLGHFIAYLTLMAWWGQLARAGWPRVAVAVALVAMGTALELVQGLTDYRSLDPVDMAANGVGVVAGFLLVLTPLGGLLAALDRRLGSAAR